MYTYYYAEFYLHATRERFSMHTQRKTRLISIIVAVFVAAIACVVGFVLAMSSTHFDDRNRGLYSADRVDATDPSPRRQYSSLSVEFQSGLLAYVGITKVGDLKKGITVKGTYLAGGSGDKTVVLDDSEYVININDVSYNDNDYVYYEDETIPSNFNCSVSCGTASAAVGTLEVKNPFGTFIDDDEAANNKIPQYESIKIELPEGVSTVADTHNGDSLKKFIVVKGVVGTTEEVIANKELLDITVNGSFSSGQKVNVSATYKYKYDESGNILTSNAPSANSDFTVSAAELGDVHVAVKNDIRFISGTWVKPDTFHAFVSGMNNARVAESLDIFYEYNQNTYKHVVVGGSVSGAGYNYFTVTNNNFEGVSGSTAINVALYNNSIGDGESASITLNFETQRILKITAEHKYSGAKSSTIFNKDHFDVIPTYNNGVVATSPLVSSQFEITPNSYAPTPDQLNSVAEGGTYTKKLNVKLSRSAGLDSSISTSVETNDIILEKLGNIGSISGTPNDQTVLTEFNYSDLYVQAYFGTTMFPTNLYLPEYKDYLSITFYDESGNQIASAVDDGKTLIPSTKVKAVAIMFNYNGKTAQGFFQNITVSPAEVDLPDLSVVEMDYSSNCFKQIRGIDFEKVAVNNISVGELDIEIKVEGDEEKLLAKYDSTISEGSAIAGEKLSTEFASYEKSTGKITFLRGGTFTVILRLKNTNFGWKDPGTSNPSRNGTSELVYTIVVNKAELNIRLDGDKDETSGSVTDTIALTYGNLQDSDGKTTFNAWESRIHYSIMGSSSYITNDTPENKPTFVLLYYGFSDGGNTYTYNRALNEDGTYDLSTFSYTCPKNVTETGYKVAVYTPGNQAYKASLMLVDNVATITVAPKEIEAGDAVDNTKVYSRTEWSIDEFVNVNNAKSFLEYEDGDTMSTTNPIISVSGMSSEAEPSGKYKHAGTYSATFTVNSKNYVWKDSTTTNASGNSTVETTFTINKAIFGINASVKNNSYSYGDTVGAQPYISGYSVNGSYTNVSDTFVQPDELYPVVGDVEYYIADSSDPTKPSATKATGTDCSKWDVGNYVAKFVISLGSGDKSTDYDLPVATAPFSITPKEVNKVSIDVKVPTYNGGDIDFALSDYDSSFMTFGTLETDNTTFTSGKVVGYYRDMSDPLTLSGLDTTAAKVTVKHAADEYRVWIAFRNPENYVWKSDASPSTDNAPLAFTFEVKPLKLAITDQSGATNGADGYVGGSYNFRYKGIGVDHGKPAFNADNAISTDGVAIVYTVTDSQNKDVDESTLLTLGVGEYNMTFDFTVSTDARKTDYVLPDVLPTTFRVLAAELMFPSLKGSAEGEMPIVEIKDGNLVATYIGAKYDVKNYLQSNTAGITSLAGLDIATDKDPINADTYTITVKPATNYSWANGQTFNDQTVTDTDNKQLEISFTFDILQKKVTIAWDNDSLTKIYDGTAQKPSAKVTDDEIYSVDSVAVVVSVGTSVDDAKTNGGESGQAKTDASSYIAIAYKLIGTGTDNYAIDEADTNYSKTFVIDKQAIKQPAVPSGSFDFVQNKDGIDFVRNETDTNKGWDWLFGTDTTKPNVTVGSLTNATFNTSDGKFTYTQAGEYIVSLTIGDTTNYKWATETSNTLNLPITINKTSLAAPKATETVTFDETDKKIQLTAGAGTTWASLAASGTYDPHIGGMVDGVDHFGARLPNTYVEFSVSAGTFQYVDAGVYTLTVTIGASKSNNFYWGTDETATETTITVTVKRKEISIPKLETYYLEWKDGQPQHPEIDMTNLGALNYVTKYGSYDGTNGYNTSKYENHNNSVERGQYYMYFELSDNGQNSKNYMFVADYIVTETANGIVPRLAYIVSYDEIKDGAGVGFYINYAITSKVLTLQFDFGSYKFGENFYGSNLKSLADMITLTASDSDKKAFAQDMSRGKVEITVTFTAKNIGDIYTSSVKWTATANEDAYDSIVLPWSKGIFTVISGESYLQNCLPINADIYAVSIKLDFDEDRSDYQDREFSGDDGVELTVNKFAIAVSWDKESDTIPYDGAEHGPTVTGVTNAPTLKSVSTVAGLSLAVGTDVNGMVYKTVKNARDTAYTFEVTAITGTPANGNLASNFDCSQANTATLTINKREVTIKAAAGNSDYGDDLQTKNNWTVDTTGGKLDIIADDGEALRNGITYKLVNIENGSDISLNSRGYYDVGAYKISLIVPPSGEVFDNYAIAVDTATVEYSVTPRPIAVAIDNSKTTKVYGVALGDTNFITISGNAANDTASDVYSYTVKKGEEALDRYSSIGDYTIVLTATDNYNITSTTGEAKYVVTPATLTVSVNLVKYYGEIVPDDFKKANEYLYETQSGRNTGIYSIEGFARDDDKTAFYAQSNADLTFNDSVFGYTVDEENKVITFIPNGLAWGNYVFDGKAGELTVENLTVSVTVKKQSVTYYDNTNIPAIMTKDVGFTVAYSPSSFNDGAIELSAEPTFSDLFALTTQAVINGKTNNVGEYDIVATANEENTAGKYNVSFVNVGDNDTYAKYYEITPATLLNVKQLADFTDAKFAQADITPNVANGVTLAETVDSVDKGTTVSVKYLIGNGDNAPTDTDWESAGGDMPKFYHAGEYKVYYLIYADNHDSVVKSFTVNIGKATDNRFNSHFNYEGKVAESVSTDMSIAWEYGSYKIFAQQAAYSDPATDYYVKPDGSNAPILVTLYYSTDGIAWGAALNTREALAHGSEIYKLLENDWNVSEFNAGYYKLVFEMDGNSNFDAPTPDERYFRVGKATLTVTPTGEYSTTYGESFDGLGAVTYSVAGYKLDDETNMPTDVTSALGAIVWTTKYSIGDHATSTDHVYIIEIDDKSAAKYSTQNYVLDFETVDLRVDKREVAIEINKDLAVYYNLYSYQAQSGTSPIYVDDAYTVSKGSFYNGEKPIKLVTDAYSVIGDQYKTNNVGEYDINIAYNDRSDGSRFDIDYNIVYTVGTFKVNVSTIFAQIKVFDNINVSSKEYDGNPVAAELDSFDDKVSNDLKNSFTPKYYRGSDNKGDVIDAPYNAGEYFVEFIYAPADENEANNYLIFTAGKYFTITKINITIRVDTFETYNADNNMSIVYGSNKPAPNAVESGNGFSGLKYTLHRDNNNTPLTEDEISAIASFETGKGNKWDVSALRFDIPSYNPNVDANRALDVKITHYIDATNYNFSSNDGRVQVVPREITVTIKGVDQLATGDKKLAQGKYLAVQNDQRTHLENFNGNVASNLGNLAKFFEPEIGWKGNSDDVLSDLGLSFAYFDNRQGETLDVGKYAIKGQYNNSNYIVAFAAPSDAQDGSVYYEVIPAALTIKTIVTDSVTGKKSELIYGNEIIVTYEPVGYLNGQIFGDLVAAGKAGGGVVHDSTYAQWTTGVGSYDVIHSSDPTDELWFKNYSVSFEKCTFKVVAREITVDDIKSVVYDEEADKTYNGGAKGKAQHAVVNFTDTAASQVIKGKSGDAENESYDGTYGLPARGVGYTISYVYSGNASEKYVNGAAPDKAGTYNVTITLTSACKNYKFATDSIAKTYTIDKKEVSLNWNNGAVNFEEEKDEARNRFIANFKPDIMRVVSFYRFSTDTEDVQEDTVEYIDRDSWKPSDSHKYYTYDTTKTEEKLWFRAYSAGYYTVKIELNDASRRNYYINGDPAAYEVALRLVATTKHITFNVLCMDGNSWIYGKPAGTLKLDTNAGSSGFAISYAKFYRGNSTWDDIWMSFGDTSVYFANSGFDSIEGLNISSFTSQMPSDVGVYVLSAYYSATGQSRYCLFRITPDTVKAPTINGDASRDYTYTGSTLVFDVTRYNNQMTVDTGSLVAAPITGGIRVGATNVGSYPITVSIDTENYVFATDCGAWMRNDDSTLSYVWQITQAQEVITVSDIERDYDGWNNYADPVTSTKFGGKIDIHYAEKKDGVADSALTGWLAQKPTRVGTFAIRAVVDGTGNYLGDTKYATLVISPVVLTVIPYGSMVYGETFDPNGTSAYGVRYSGFVGDDSVNNVTFSGRVTYGIDRDGSTGLLDAKTYSMSVDVSRYATANYTIVGGTGEFVVTPKKITVEIIGSSSTYGDTVDASSLVSRYRVIGYEIAPELLGITPALVGVDDYAHLDARSYSVVADSYTNSNFDIAFTPGTYTVDPLRITIGAIDVKNGEVDVITAPSVTSWIWHGENNAVGNLTAAQVAELVYGFVYTDSASGAEIAFDELKSKVGSYYVLVTQTNPNYRLTGQTTYSFRVLARTVYGTQITIADLAFNNSVQVPVIDFGDYNPSLFEITYFGDRTNVGTHYAILSLGDNPNYSWSESTSREYRIPFEIVRGDNALVSLDINGWVYGEYKAAENSPVAVTRFGSSSEHIFNYYTKNGDAYERLTGVPVNAGTYYVTVTVPLAPNYNAFTSDYVSFAIEKAVHSVPTLNIITEGEGKNDTYTGEALPAVVLGFDSTEMSIHYDGISNINGNVVTVYATDANTYTIRLALRNDGNYRWAESSAIDDDGYAVLTWTIAKKKIAVPTDNTGRFVVNGTTLTYIPEGFDESIMNISGNTTSYGGTFRVTVTLKDPSNYEWIVDEDGVVRNAYDFTWNVVGADTVFSIVMGILGGLFGAAAVAVLVQFIIHKKRIGGLKPESAAAAGNGNAPDSAATTTAETAADTSNVSEGE